MIPQWTIMTLKFLGPVVMALAIGYARFITVENRVAALETHAHDIDTKGIASDTIVTGMDRRLNTAEVKQQVIEKDLSASLIRIESVIKEIQIDVKDLQKRK